MAVPTRAQLRELYFGEGSYALRFQAMWTIFDLSVIAFFIAAPIHAAPAAWCGTITTPCTAKPAAR